MMEIYRKNTDGQLEETTLKDLLKFALQVGDFEMDNGSFLAEGHHWVGIVQKTDKPSKILVNINFNDDDEITEVHVFETPIKLVEDDDNAIQII